MPYDNLTQAIIDLVFALLVSFIVLSLVAGVSAGLFLAYGFWRKSKTRHKKSLETTLLEVSLPRENEIKIDAAEQLFSSLVGIKGVKGWFHYLKVPDSISFEIVARGQDIRFYVGVPSKMRDMVEKQIHGSYPDAQIMEVEDYNLFENPGKIAYASLKLKKSPYLPIKTYRDLAIDPLSSITSTIGKMAEGEAAAIQILIANTPDAWKKAGRAHITSTKKREANPETAKYSVDQKELEAIEQKISKPGFQIYVRILVTSATKEAADMHLENIQGSFAQFASYNSFEKEKNKYFKGMLS